MNWTIWIVLGSIAAALSVALGAFGAHALKDRLDEHALSIFEVGTRYHMYHALGLIALGMVASRIDNMSLKVAGWAFIVGILLFSGSLYVLALSGIRWLGMITPLGGLAFIVGWTALALAVLRP